MMTAGLLWTCDRNCQPARCGQYSETTGGMPTLFICLLIPPSCRDQTANYVTKFVAGAKATYGLSIDFIGQLR